MATDPRDEVVVLLRRHAQHATGSASDAMLTAADTIAALREKLEAAERRAYELAVAIMGGEDAPGYADSIPTQQLVDQQRKMAAECMEVPDLRERLEAVRRDRDDVIEHARSLQAALTAARAEGAANWLAVVSRDRINDLLRDYRQDEVRDEDGYGYPLVDALTLDGHSIDMGEREIFNISDMLAGELTPPADLTAALDEVTRQAWNEALEKAAGIVDNNMLCRGADGADELMPRSNPGNRLGFGYSAAIRALRKEAP